MLCFSCLPVRLDENSISLVRMEQVQRIAGLIIAVINSVEAIVHLIRAV